jgi:hypothetical protein
MGSIRILTTTGSSNPTNHTNNGLRHVSSQPTLINKSVNLTASGNSSCSNSSSSSIKVLTNTCANSTMVLNNKINEQIKLSPVTAMSQMMTPPTTPTSVSSSSGLANQTPTTAIKSTKIITTGSLSSLSSLKTTTIDLLTGSAGAKNLNLVGTSSKRDVSSLVKTTTQIAPLTIGSAGLLDFFSPINTVLLSFSQPLFLI